MICENGKFCANKIIHKFFLATMGIFTKMVASLENIAGKMNKSCFEQTLRTFLYLEKFWRKTFAKIMIIFVNFGKKFHKKTKKFLVKPFYTAELHKNSLKTPH